MPLRAFPSSTGILFLLLCCTSCSFGDAPKERPSTGHWESVGYGWGLSLTDSTYAFYALTPESCLPGPTGDLEDISFALSVERDTLYYRVGFDVYRYLPRPELPASCGHPLSPEKAQDAEYNFTVFASTVAKHFAYFTDNGINWDSLYRANRAKITSQTSAAELFLTMDSMLVALDDNHGYVEPTDEVYEAAEALLDPATENTGGKEYGDFVIAGMVADTFLDHNLTQGRGIIRWGTIQDSIGYLQINAMMLHAELDIPQAVLESEGFVGAYFTVLEQYGEPEQSAREVAGIRQSMDRAIEDLADTKFIILDVRFNGGGNDDVSLEILRHFNAERRLVATKKARTEGGYSPEVPIYLEASENAYSGPVYVLTSRQSASATDFLVLASLAMDNLTRVGSRTNGALSDALGKPLPNGWYFSISNEVYEDTRGVCYETVGVPPDYELHYDEDRQTFFRAVANDLAGDKRRILKAIEAIRTH